MSRPADETLRVVIADDHPFYRKGLARSLRAHGIEVVAEAPNGEAAIRAVESTSPDVVVMDLKMPGVSGLEATRELTQRAIPTRVLVLSVSAEDTDVTEAVLAGASGYVLKELPVEEVIAAIRAAASGSSHLSPAIAMLLTRRLFEPGGVDVDLAGVRLSQLELRLLDLIAKRMSDREIADALAIEEDAVGAHASSVLAKLEVGDRLGAALRAYRRRYG
jgi:DNA-binding NarL/FixJ family response regulator